MSQGRGGSSPAACPAPDAGSGRTGWSRYRVSG
jgi:hypothetical protein